MPENTILSVRNIVKTYPGVLAINHFSMDVREGEVHALIGENGAGKATLIKTLSGAITPDEGTVCVCGKEFAAMTPKLAKEQGIEMCIRDRCGGDLRGAGGEAGRSSGNRKIRRCEVYDLSLIHI